MYDSTDPRSTLASAVKPVGAIEFAGAEYGKFYEAPPQEENAQARSWYIRAQNFVVAYSEAKAGAVFARKAQPDEYVILLPDPRTLARLKTPQGDTKLAGYTITIVPPGDSELTISADGPVVRFFTTQSRDLAGKCSNAASYANAHPNVAPLRPWPDPPEGFRVRTYSLDVREQPGRFGRIFRCTTFMINFFDPKHGPRDITKLSPHFHDDFEQGSLALEGAFIHDIRWPWTTNLNAWREDQHEHCASPSLVVIPPPAIHTSRAVGEGVNQLVDIFCPPRIDFSEKPGWVLNDKDYPMPHPVKV